MKTRPPKTWSDGVEIEDAAVRTLRPALGRSVRAMRGQVDGLGATATPGDYLGIDWDLFRTPIREAWETASGKAMEIAVSDAVAMTQVRKDAPVDRLPEVQALAAEWARTNALQLAEHITLRTADGVRVVLANGLERGLSVDEITRDIRAMVGNTVRDTRAVMRMRTRLEVRELAVSRIDSMVRGYSNRLIRARAGSIARTEINRARNVATTETWEAMKTRGDLDVEAKRIWIEAGGCPICQALAMHPPVGMREPFQSSLGPLMQPPAHPRCRCSQGLVFPKDAVG